MSSPGEFFIYNGSIGYHAGAEWNFVGSTSLVLEAGYYYGITPYFLDRKDANKTMYNVTTILISPPERSYYSASARQNQLIFKLSCIVLIDFGKGQQHIVDWLNSYCERQISMVCCRSVRRY